MSLDFNEATVVAPEDALRVAQLTTRRERLARITRFRAVLEELDNSLFILSNCSQRELQTRQRDNLQYPYRENR